MVLMVIENLLTIRNAIHRVNRGIILAVILVVGLTGCLIYDNNRFDTEKTAIKTCSMNMRRQISI